ncbi:MAG TPA: prepilin-type N-terminal cleavage/methylation domain-containing protein [Acidobacteriaceae bacterium]|jgi:prepilin-type N-terminal cleavage/methylation domain-containing protein|nr:prepilin-type N-terminal cleavage/methylation domain-containing protein [Acidobacteriaceae bacterium]
MVSRKNSGFSLLELMITVSIGLVLAGVGFIAFRPLLSQADINSGYDTTLMALRNTRNLAITQSHEYFVNFNPAGFPAGTIQVQYQPGPVGGIAQPIQQVITYSIPADVSFAVQAGFPANAPDGFGAGVNAIDFGQGLAGEPLNYVIFMPDGSSQAFVVGNSGTYNSGVVYLTRPGDNMYVSSRAITVWGATGRIRGWRLGQTAGVGAWVQQ